MQMAFELSYFLSENQGQAWAKSWATGSTLVNRLFVHLTAF